MDFASGGWDEEKKCLLTPTSLNSHTFMQSESDLVQDVPTAVSVDATSSQPAHQFFFTSPLIYSEPALSSLGNSVINYNNVVSCAYSEATLPNVYVEYNISPSGLPGANMSDGSKQASHHHQSTQPFNKVLSKGFTPKSSCFFSESQPSIITVMGSITIPHKQSFSTREIREQHMQIQKKYRPSRKRHYTDPVDFEGILNIIGGCSWWQIWVYLLISLQQIPHAMFNLSVVYMMYQPDHWCQVPGMNDSSSKQPSNYLWAYNQTMGSSIVYPKTKNKQRDLLDFHSQCHYYDRGTTRYEELRHMSIYEMSSHVWSMFKKEGTEAVCKCGSRLALGKSGTTSHLSLHLKSATHQKNMEKKEEIPAKKPKMEKLTEVFHPAYVQHKTEELTTDVMNFIVAESPYLKRLIVSNHGRAQIPTRHDIRAEVPRRADITLSSLQTFLENQQVMKNTIVTEWNLVCDDNFKRAHAHLFYSFGFLFGCLLGGFASDRFGRKPTVIGFGILSSMFGLILPYSTYFPMFLFIRFCGAVCNEAADLAAYVLCMEITGTRYRAMVGSLLQAPWAVGYATLALIAYFCKSWQYIQLITAALHTISICLICVLPESPRWLIVNNRVEEAERYIRRACRDPPFPFNLCNFSKCSLPCDLELVKHAEQRKWVKRHQRANILHLLKSRALCVRTGIICIVWIATALVYYGLVIALSDQSAPGRVLFSGNFFVNNAIAGAIELPTLLVCVYLMKYGRKRAQMFTLMGAAIFIFLAMGAIIGRSPMLALCSMLMGKIFIQGAFNILYIFTSEMYPTVIRNSAVGFCSMIARLGSGVSSYVAILSDVTLAIVPMIIFATFSLFAGMLVMLLPETRDQPLPDTLQDAVTFLKNNHKYECYYGFGGGHAVGDADGKQSMSAQGEEDSRLNVGAVGTTTKPTTTANTPTPHEEGVSQDGGSTATTGEDIALATADATSISRKRSDTFNELPSIPEVPDHCEEHNLLLLDETSANEKDELAEVPLDNNRKRGDKQCTPTLSRQRHRAGAGNRKVSTENLIRNLSNADSLFKDLTDISIPDKLNEPFD